MSKIISKEKRTNDNYYLRFIKLSLLFVFFILFKSTVLFAQPKDNAPYSRIGLGEQVNPILSSASFGGLSAGYNDPLHINFLNPASYGWLGAATFEAGMFTEKSDLKVSTGEEEKSTPVWTGNLGHLSLAFPMRNPLNDVLENKKRKVFWGMNIALLPNTIVGYDIETEEVTPNGDSTINSFQGTGGTTKFIWGNGFRYKNFSGGINISYIFGQLESERRVFFSNLGGNYFFNDYVDNISVTSLQFTFGLQYKLQLDKKRTEEGTVSDHNLIIGFYGNPSSSFRTKSTRLRIGVNSIFNQTDTLQNVANLEENGKLPGEWTLGAIYQLKDRLRVGAEYGRAGWSNYENEAKEEKLYNSSRVAVGVEYSPNPSSYNNYFKRIRYRAGFYYRNDPRLEDLKQYALTIGFGLPIILPRGQTSFVNLGVELGRFDTDNAITENFMKMSVGFTLNDGTWFYKRKFR